MNTNENNKQRTRAKFSQRYLLTVASICIIACAMVSTTGADDSWCEGADMYGWGCPPQGHQQFCSGIVYNSQWWKHYHCCYDIGFTCYQYGVWRGVCSDGPGGAGEVICWAQTTMIPGWTCQFGDSLCSNIQ